MEQKMKTYRGKLRNGFTLVEAIVANIVLCASVITLGAFSTLCLTHMRLDRLNQTAVSLADRQLTVIDYMGIENFIERGRFEGEFETADITYNWHADAEYLQQDKLYQVTMTITWIDGVRQYRVTVPTRLNGRSSSTQTTSQTGQSTR
jgi:hypothetical protein